MMKKIGFIVNPVAGLGGRAGFKGSDNPENQKKALLAGYEKLAPLKAGKCMEILHNEKNITILAPDGAMGGDILKSLDISFQKLELNAETTTREHTLYFAKVFQENNVDLIVFCGGDGTARDICSIISTSIPVIAIPAGVKMYSGCFAVTPLIAGELLRNYLQKKTISFELQEVMDIDESLLGQHSISPHLYGYLKTPKEPAKIQGSKVASSTVENEVEILADYHVKEMEKDVLYLIGPGSTTFQIKKKMDGTPSLLGVDAVCNGKIIHKDGDEKSLLHLMKSFKRTAVIVTCLGGSGFVFGRGNQQISSQILKKISKQDIHLCITKSKLTSLQQKPLLVDTGDANTDQSLCGYYRIPFSHRESAFYKISNI